MDNLKSGEESSFKILGERIETERAKVVKKNEDEGLRVEERRAMDLKYWTGFVEGVEGLAKLLVELWGGFQGFFEEWKGSYVRVSGKQISEVSSCF